MSLFPVLKKASLDELLASLPEDAVVHRRFNGVGNNIFACMYAKFPVIIQKEGVDIIVPKLIEDKVYICLKRGKDFFYSC